MQPEQSELGHALDESAVLRFLTLNPEFFNQHSDVLPRLRIPHHTGAAISLIEKQVSVLRGKCTNLESSLRDLIAVARDNEQLHQRLHQLVQDIISAQTLTEVVARRRESLLTNFNADDVCLGLFEPVATPLSEALPSEHVLSVGEKTQSVFAKNIKLCDTYCGELSEEQASGLFGDNGRDEIASAAVIPLVYEKSLGLMVLTSKDESRFAAGKGVMFLNQLGEVLSRRLHAML